MLIGKVTDDDEEEYTEIYTNTAVKADNGVSVLSQINYYFMSIVGNGWGLIGLFILVYFLGSNIEHYYVTNHFLNLQSLDLFAGSDSINSISNATIYICLAHIILIPPSLKIFKASGYLQIARSLIVSFVLMCIPILAIYTFLYYVCLLYGLIGIGALFIFGRNYTPLQLFSRSTYCMPEEYQQMLQQANIMNTRQKNLAEEQRFAEDRRARESASSKDDIMKPPPGYKWYRVQGILKENGRRFDFKTLKRPTDVDAFLKSDPRFSSFHVLGAVCNIDDFNRLPSI